MTETSGRQILTSDCGHHCFVQTQGRIRITTHCGCSECHDGPVADPTAETVS